MARLVSFTLIGLLSLNFLQFIRSKLKRCLTFVNPVFEI
jgi:hypothetical protein